MMLILRFFSLKYCMFYGRIYRFIDFREKSYFLITDNVIKVDFIRIKSLILVNPDADPAISDKDPDST